MISVSSVFCPRAGPSLQVQKPRLQFCRRQVFHRKLRSQGCSFTRMNRCSSFPLLSAPHSLLASEKIPGAPMWRWGEWIWLTVPSRLQNSPQGLNYQIYQGFWPDQRSGNPNRPLPPNFSIFRGFIAEIFNQKTGFWNVLSFWTNIKAYLLNFINMILKMMLRKWN